MKKYEIINPSDECFIEGEDFKTVCIATIILGEGRYGLQEVDGELSMPLMLFGEEWFVTQFGESFEESLKSIDTQKLETVLLTVKLSGERSSLNDIEKYAKNVVENLKLLRKQEC